MYGTTIDDINEPSEVDEKLNEFEARIASGEKIEPGDWMPDEYRRQLIRMISQHAHSEIVGMLPRRSMDHTRPKFTPQDDPARKSAG
jgi:hypothetical protein